ncbi:MAG: PIN domain nuclease [Deltaproteobacteria bacterium]|nr:PIN domain nuclease [Deltaproteobacteria bacterium]
MQSVSVLVLVDTSVWIDFLQRPRAKIHEEMTRLIQGTNRVLICGLVMQEILQGLKSSRSTHLFQSRLQKLPFLPTRKSTYILAAGIFRKLKEKGVEVQTVDATSAAIAIENRVSLFTLNLRHFVPMRHVCKLRLHPMPIS